MLLPEKQNLKNLNRVILAVIAILSILSLIMIYSATSTSDATGFKNNFFLKQAIWVIISFAMLILVSNVSYEIWIGLSPWMYYMTIGLLLILLLIGKNVFGSVRWFHLGPIAFQPSEFAKASLVLMLTKFISDNKGKIDLLEGMGKTFVIIGVPMSLILLQPDLGTTLIFIPMVFFMLFISGMKKRYLLSTFGLLAAIAPIFYFFLMKDYQKKRITSFLNPESDPLGSGYSLIQSKIAVGSGGFFGKGLFKGTQSQLNFIPEHHTDFIFSVIGEELGFAGAVVILFLYYMLIMEGIKIAIYAKDRTSTILATGIVSIFITQVFVNIGMTLGILPVVGVPLPFLSYGGSSLLFSMFLAGILLNIHRSIKKFST
ncbi:MAG: rod shape-determining protein RodA [Candidatus Firestonebacteria bacterium]